MGQWWYPISVDNAETTGHLGKYWEFMFDGSADCLIDLLALPVVPGLAESSKSSTSPRDVPGAESSSNVDDSAFIPQGQPCLVTLPNELLIEVFDRLDLGSCVRLCFTSVQLWEVGWPYVQRRITTYMGTWAGSRIICLGDECAQQDLPTGFLTTEEWEILDQGLPEDQTEYDDSDPENSEPGDRGSDNAATEPGPASLLDFFDRGFREIYTEPVYPLEYCDDDDLLFKKAFRLPASKQDKAIGLLLGRDRKDYYPNTETWILCNLITQEYVQGDEIWAALGEPGPSPCGLHSGFPGLGEALLYRICWSTQSREGLTRGVWAGHRFEICTKTRHAARSSEGWTDVTSEIITELSTVLEISVRGREAKS